MAVIVSLYCCRQLHLMLFCLGLLMLDVSFAAHSRRRIVVRRNGEGAPQYDRSITTFSADGRLGQVEYAMEAALRGSTIAAIQLPNKAGICFVADSSSSSGATSGAVTTTKVHRIDHHVWLITAGLTGDARILAQSLRQECQNHRLTYGEPPTIQQVAKMAGQAQHQLTRTAGARPLGCTAFVLGVDDPSTATTGNGQNGAFGIPRLFETDPGGIVEECQYAVGGKGRGNLGRTVAPFANKILSSYSEEGDVGGSKADPTPSILSEKVVSGLAGLVLKEISETSSKKGSESSSGISNAVDVWTIQPDVNRRGGVKATCFRNINKGSLRQIKTLLAQAAAEK